MANFSPASETNPLKIKLAITWRRIQPGLKSQKKKPCNRNGISARAKKRAWTCAVILFSGKRHFNHFKSSYNRNKISAPLAGLKFQPGMKFAM